MPTDLDLPLIDPADGGVPPEGPAPGTPGILNLTRKRAIGNASYRIDPTAVCPLPAITPGAQSAFLWVEAAPGAVAGKALVRIWCDGQWPTVISGAPAYDGGTIEISGADDLNNCRMISADGLPHKINIQYFSYL